MDTLQIIKMVAAATLALYAVVKLRNLEPIVHDNYSGTSKKSDIKIPKGTFHDGGSSQNPYPSQAIDPSEVEKDTEAIAMSVLQSAGNPQIPTKHPRSRVRITPFGPDLRLVRCEQCDEVGRPLGWVSYRKAVRPLLASVPKPKPGMSTVRWILLFAAAILVLATL